VRSDIPAGTRIDCSGRIQMVSADPNRDYHDLIRESSV
jgi:predicted NodU family carbamoyl transferase